MQKKKKIYMLLLVFVSWSHRGLRLNLSDPYFTVLREQKHASGYAPLYWDHDRVNTLLQTYQTCISVKISLKFVPRGLIDMSAFV